jgi:diguanylate cyclase (GGDEF)-like protein
MKLAHKLLLTAILGSGALIALFLFKSFTQDYFNERNSLELNFKEIETAHRQLDNQILNNAFFLYTNQDTVNSAIERVYYSINMVLNIPHIQESHPKTYALLLEHRRLFDEKVQTIYDFQTANIVIKNTSAALLVAEQDLFKETKLATLADLAVMDAIHRTAGSILLAKNALDHELLRSLDTQIQTLSRHRFSSSVNTEKIERMFAHFKTIQEFFPRYIDTLESIQHPAIITTLKKSEKEFLRESDHELRIVSYFSYLLVFLFIISIGIIALFLVQTEREIRIDSLTRLRNRKAYEEDLKQRRGKAALILININKFKHYNDFYGVKEGDRLLVETANRIQTTPFLGQNPSYYRLGADDFGILFELSQDDDLYTVAKTFLDTFPETPILIDNELRTPSISVSASELYPLLETADMALKNKTRSNPTVYHEALNLHQIISDNVTKVKELKEALQENRVIPYYQPIMNYSTHSVTKHEVLARVIMKDGQVRSIFPYLHIAKESNLYPELTRTIVTKSFEVIATHSGDFSINLTIDDIENHETVEMLEELLNRYHSIGKRIIFEILESEAIEKYEGIVSFITKMRTYGCRIAIDDFGSGYSNFARILNLAIDIIKIDGSLIRNLDTDDKAITIVQTIVNFTKSRSIETVAEFVHNEAIAHITEQLGIDGAQGFYYYEPLEHPLV